MIPYRMNPFGITKDRGYFELVVKPGILAEQMTFSFSVSLSGGGFCRVIDWGDGSSQTSPSSGSTYTHIYAVAGTYVIQLLGHVQSFYVNYSGSLNSSVLLYDCNGNWDAIGGAFLQQLPACFFGAVNASFSSLKTLPRAVKNCNSMFYNCNQARLTFPQGLPDSIEDMNAMFGGCRLATLDLKKWPQNVKRIDSAFGGCFNSKCTFLNLPASLTNTNIVSVLNQNRIAPFTITELPDGIVNAGSALKECYKANITLKRLPSTLQAADSLFFQDAQAKIDISELAANAPPGGYALTNISHMFYSCYNVTGSRSAFLAACPNVTNTQNAFAGTNTTE